MGKAEFTNLGDFIQTLLPLLAAKQQSAFCLLTYPRGLKQINLRSVMYWLNGSSFEN